MFTNGPVVCVSVPNKFGFETSGRGINAGVQKRAVGLARSVDNVRILLNQNRSKTAQNEFAKDGATDNPGANNGHIERLISFPHDCRPPASSAAGTSVLQCRASRKSMGIEAQFAHQPSSTIASMAVARYTRGALKDDPARIFPSANVERMTNERGVFDFESLAGIQAGRKDCIIVAADHRTANVQRFRGFGNTAESGCCKSGACNSPQDAAVAVRATSSAAVLRTTSHVIPPSHLLSSARNRVRNHPPKMGEHRTLCQQSFSGAQSAFESPLLDRNDLGQSQTKFRR